MHTQLYIVHTVHCVRDTQYTKRVGHYFAIVVDSESPGCLSADVHLSNVNKISLIKYSNNTNWASLSIENLGNFVITEMLL